MRKTKYNKISLLTIALLVLTIIFVEAIKTPKYGPTTNRISALEENESIGVQNSVTVDTEEGLVAALADESISNIILDRTASGNGTPINNPIFINREVSLEGIVRLIGNGSLVVNESGKMKVRRDFYLNYRECRAKTALTINGGEVFVGGSYDGSALNTGSLVVDALLARIDDPLETAIEILSGGVLDVEGTLRVGNSEDQLEIGIKFNGGTFTDHPSGALLGHVRAKQSIVSESGLNRHQFNYGDSDGAQSDLRSGMGNPVYLNKSDASLNVIGNVEQLAMWELSSRTSSLWGETPDFATLAFDFNVVQVGNFRPIVNSINNENYQHLFSQGIFPFARRLNSVSADEVLPVPPVDAIPTAVLVSPENYTLEIGGSVHATSRVLPELASQVVHWYSLDPAIASVSDNGEIIGESAGITSIIAQTLNGTMGFTQITVRQNLPESIIVTPKNHTLRIGDSIQATSSVLPTTASQDVQWSSSNSSIASVSASGEISGESEGTTYIVAETINGLRDTIEIKVEEFIFRIDEDEGTATVIDYVGFNSDIRIPSTVPGGIVPVTRIGSYALYEKGLTSVSIPDSVVSIDEYAFGLNSLSNIEIPSSVKTIGEYAFQNNQLANVTLPDGLTNFQPGVFMSNELTSISIPDTVTTIGGYAFSQNQLTNVIIPDRVTSIGPFAFMDNSLVEVNLSDQLRSIGRSAFSNNQLSNLILPSDLNGIGYEAFYNNPLVQLKVAEDYLENMKIILSTENALANVTERTMLIPLEDFEYNSENNLTLFAGESLEIRVDGTGYQLVNLNPLTTEWENLTFKWFKNQETLNQVGNPLLINEVNELASGNYHVEIGEGIGKIVLNEVLVNVRSNIIPPVDPTDTNPIFPENPNPIMDALSLRFVSDLEFGEISISNSDQTVFSKPTVDATGQEIPNMVTVQDTRPQGSWSLTVRQSNELVSGARIQMHPFAHEQNIENFKILIFYPIMEISTSAQLFAATFSSTRDAGIVSLGMNRPENQGVQLEVPKNVGVGDFKTTLIWNLNDAPM